jgi:predicted ester cyclase
MSDVLSENKAAVLVHFAALQTGDFSALRTVHADTGRNHAQSPFDLSAWPEEGVPFGPAEVQETFEWLRRAMPDLRVEMEALVAEADHVIAWVRIQGTQTVQEGAARGIGGSVDFRHAHRFRLENGRIVEHWAVRDDLRALIQAGVVSPPGRAAT